MAVQSCTTYIVRITQQARIFGQILPIFSQVSAKNCEISLKIDEIWPNSASQKIPGLLSYTYMTVPIFEKCNFRDRFDELLEFAPAMDQFLTDAEVAHEIVVINQVDTLRFNRAALINAGFIYTNALNFDYMAMHDVDLIPTTHQIKYDFPENGPVHLASPELHPKYHYANYVGGILMLTHQVKRQITKN